MTVKHTSVDGMSYPMRIAAAAEASRVAEQYYRRLSTSPPPRSDISASQRSLKTTEHDGPDGPDRLCVGGERQQSGNRTGVREQASDRAGVGKKRVAFGGNKDMDVISESGSVRQGPASARSAHLQTREGHGISPQSQTIVCSKKDGTKAKAQTQSLALRNVDSVPSVRQKMDTTMVSTGRFLKTAETHAREAQQRRASSAEIRRIAQQEQIRAVERVLGESGSSPQLAILSPPTLPVAHVHRGPTYAWREEKSKKEGKIFGTTPMLAQKAREMPGADLVRRHADVFTEALLDHVLDEVVFTLSLVEKKPREDRSGALSQAVEKLNYMENSLCNKYNIPIDERLRLDKFYSEGNGVGDYPSADWVPTASSDVQNTQVFSSSRPASSSERRSPQPRSPQKEPDNSTNHILTTEEEVHQKTTSGDERGEKKNRPQKEEEREEVVIITGDNDEAGKKEQGMMIGYGGMSDEGTTVPAFEITQSGGKTEIREEEGSHETDVVAAGSLEAGGGDAGVDTDHMGEKTTKEQQHVRGQPEPFRIHSEIDIDDDDDDDEVREKLRRRHKAKRHMHVDAQVLKSLDLYRYRFRQHTVAAREGALQDGQPRMLSTWNVWPSLAWDILDDVILGVAREMDAAVSGSVDRMVKRETNELL